MLTSPIELRLLPKNCSIAANGSLAIHNISVLDIVNEFGTPIFIYDESHIRDNLLAAKSAFGPKVAYASKAFLNKAMAKLVAEIGIRIDVSSSGELYGALAGSIMASDIVYHGNNKSYEELLEAVRLGVGDIVIDSQSEIDRIESILKNEKREIIQPVSLRITPGIEAHTHEYVKTGQEDTKFGFSLRTGEAESAIRRVLDNHRMSLISLHFHIGSQIFNIEAYKEAITAVLPVVEKYEISHLVVGGGLGVPYLCSDPNTDIHVWANYLKTTLKELGFSEKVTLSAEPGRSIVATAGITCYTIGEIKIREGIRTYVAVDGGMSDNPRPVLYGSGYEVFSVKDVLSNRPFHCTIVGKHCESGDVLVREGHLPENIKVGDILSTPVTGAYGYSMASNYNKLPRPPVVFVSESGIKLVSRRETVEDMYRLDI